MNTESLIHPVAGPVSLLRRAVAGVRDRITRFVAALRAWRAARAETRHVRQIERDLAHLSLHTLKDIGAPPGMIDRRRVLDQLAAEQRAVEQRLRS